MRSAYQDFVAHYRANAPAAEQLLAVGESPGDRSLPPAELAALTMVANQIFSLDEALNKDDIRLKKPSSTRRAGSFSRGRRAGSAWPRWRRCSAATPR